MKKCLFPCLRNEEKPDALSFFLGIFSDNTRLFGIIWASLWEKLFSGVGGGGGGVSTKSVSNQSPQLKRLAWKLKFHLQQVYIWYFPKSKKKKRRWSDCADAQAGLRLCCSQTPEDRVSRVEAHIIAVFMIRAIVNELHPTFFFVFFLILIESSFSFVELFYISFVLPSDVWLISAHNHGRILRGGGGGGKFKIRHRTRIRWKS